MFVHLLYLLPPIGLKTCRRHKDYERQKDEEKRAKGSRFAQQQRLRKDNGSKPYQRRDPDQAEQNDKTTASKTKHCLSRIWLWGWYFIVRPCGFILVARPLFISESNDQILAALNDAFPTSDKPSYVWLDKACQFWYWLLDPLKPQRMGDWKDVVFLVDRFHQLAGHLGDKTSVAKFCKEYCHSSIERYRGVRGVDGSNLGNSEAAEQTFSRFVNFGATCMNMTLCTQTFFVFNICETLNSLLCMELAERKVSVIPGKRPNF